MNKTFENCTLLDTKSWFSKARPSTTEKDFQSQIGVHFEEVTEMLDQITGNPEAVSAIMDARRAMKKLADLAKGQKADIKVLNEVLLLDSICDQIVTGTGVSHCRGHDIVGAMTEVNRSNFSKFGEDGQPLYDENGKVIKGPNYSKAVLGPYVPGTLQGS